MPEIRQNDHSPPPAGRCNGIRDRMLLGLVLISLVHTGDALAGEPTVVANVTQNPEENRLRRSAPPPTLILDTSQLFKVPAAGESPGFSPTEFRPRKHGVIDNDVVNPFGDVPMVRGTSVWQRLSEYKTHDRVRVLTLWESSGSTVSLQAGKHGDPSLQWSSRLMNRGGATEGLLDRLFSASLAHAGSSLRNVARPTSVATLKQSSVPLSAEAK